ncbi:MAG: hypothetical protein IJS81_11955 [Selenomonadaceae bacterium]|nr:hypothetical protein [Selenomonadaceae bacterium]
MATLLLALAIVVPALTTEAAYVFLPNFYDITSNRIEKRIDFLGMDQKSHNGVYYAHWKYEVCDGKTSEYVDRYINKIDSKHDFRLIGRDGNHWYFLYTGNQAQYIKPINGSFHVHVGRSGNKVVVDCAGGIHPE